MTPPKQNGNPAADSPDSPGSGRLGPSMRHERILKLVQAKGFVTIENLARAFGVTPQTIRRDITLLSRDGGIHRFHGGAGTALSTENVAYNERKIMRFEEKRSIAQMVARQVPDHASLFINIGTTTEAVAHALVNHKALTVITNNLNVASILSANEQSEVIVSGGMLRHRDGGLVGQATIDFIGQFRADYGIIGISGIDMDGTLLDFDYREVRATRAIMDNSRKVFLVADHTKFGRSAMARLCNISEIHSLFTDQPPPDQIMAVITRAEVQLHVARPDEM